MANEHHDSGPYLVAVLALGWIGGIGAFFSTWYAAASEYGFIIGFLLGWIPAYVAGLMVFFTAAIWVPLLGLAAMWIAYLALTGR